MSVALTTRDKVGTKSAKDARRMNLTPATIYGRGADSRSVVIDTPTIEQILREKGRNAVFNVSVDEADDEMVMVHHVQREPIHRDILNVEFLLLAKGQKVKVMVPIELVDDETIHEAVVNQVLLEVEVEVDPTDIPSEFTISVAGMEIGDSKEIRDLEVPENVEILHDPDDTVVNVLAPREEEEDEEDEEAVDPAAVEAIEQDGDDEDEDSDEA